MRYLLAAAMAGCLAAQAPYERILRADAEPGNWMTYSRTFDGQRFSLLDQIHTGNVGALRPAWIYQSATNEERVRFETSAIAVDGILYITEQPSEAAAIDGRTGRALWKYHRDISPEVRTCCGRVNRGMAILGDRLFLGTLDAHLVALDRVTGRVLWDVEVADVKLAYTITVAPLALQDRVIVGISGGEFGIRGFLDAYDARTGKRLWRFHTVPSPGEPGSETWEGDSWKNGAAATWTTGAYDPALDLIYWGTGNPGPDYNATVRRGDNLYSCSLLAIEAASGKLRWHFQFTPGDDHDWDANHTPVLVDRGAEKTVMVANRNGFFYVLDRVTGKFLSGQAFAHQTWAERLDERGRPVLQPGASPSIEGPVVFPGLHGGTNWFSTSYSPKTGWIYIATRHEGTRFFLGAAEYRPGFLYVGGGPGGMPRVEPGGYIQALDPWTGERKWKFDLSSPPWAGVMATAGGLVFGASNEGAFYALDARSGKALWHFQTGGWINANPVSYTAAGKQYVLIPSGHALVAFALP